MSVVRTDHTHRSTWSGRGLHGSSGSGLLLELSPPAEAAVNRTETNIASASPLPPTEAAPTRYPKTMYALQKKPAAGSAECSEREGIRRLNQRSGSR